MGVGESYDRWTSNKPSSPPPAVLASGPETELKNDCLETLRSLMDAEAPEEITFYADEASPEQFVQEIRGRGLFNDSKIVVLKHLERRAPGQGRQLARYQPAVEDYLENPEENVLLFLMDRDHPYRTSRQTGAIARAVESAGGDSIIFWEPFDDSLREFVQSAFRDSDVAINPPAVQTLLERTRGKYSRLKREVEKLMNSVEGTVTEDHVEALITREEASDGFQAIKDDIVGGEMDSLLTDLGDLWRRGEAPPKVFHVVFSFLNSVREVNQLRSEGVSLEEALSESGLPNNKSVKTLFKRATKRGGLKIPRDFFGKSYETGRSTKYSGKSLARRSLEFFVLRFIHSNNR